MSKKKKKNKNKNIEKKLENKNKKKNRTKIYICGLLIILIILIIGITVNYNRKESVKTKTYTNSELYKNSFTGKPKNVVEYNITAEEHNSKIKLNNKDQLTLKTWLYNNKLASNILRVKLGQKIKVNFTNKLKEPTTIHWHGVRIPNGMDGVPYVTQNPVMPNEKFVYEFTPKDAGTFWFHPHTDGSRQLEKGLYGALIVEDPKKEYNKDIVLMIDDWRLTRDGQIDENYATPMDLMHDGRWGQLVTVNGKVDPEYKLNIGDKVRVRLINTANARIFIPASNLDWTVIAIDGMNLETPKKLKDLVPFLSPGSRIDLEYTVTKKTIKNISIIDKFSEDYKNNLVKFKVENGVDKKAPILSKAKPNIIPDWTYLKDRKPDYTYVLSAESKNMTINWEINKQVYDKKVKEIFKKGKLIKIRFDNQSPRVHPMHIHSQFFQVIARNGILQKDKAWKDTVLVKPFEKVDIAMAPVDTGIWLLHCHIQEHADAGMMRLIEVKE